MTRVGHRRRYSTGIDHTRGQVRAGVVGALGLFIILFNLVSAIGLGSTQDSQSRMLAGLSGKEIVLCTGNGMIVLDQDGKPLGEGGQVSSAHCPYCVPTMQAACQVPVATPLVQRVGMAKLAGFALETAAPLEAWKVRSSSQPRAPPAS